MNHRYAIHALGLLAIALAGCDGGVVDVEVQVSIATPANGFAEDPIVFVHGCPVPASVGGVPTGIGSGSNYRTALLWQKMYAYFRDHGYPAAAWSGEDADADGYPDQPIPGSQGQHSSPPGKDSYLNILVLSEGEGGSGTCGSHFAHAAELAAYVEQVLQATGAKKVDIVANSLGGMAARWYLKPSDPNLDAQGFPTFGGAIHVRDMALLAVPNHGTDVALVTESGTDAFASPNYDGARQAAPAYNCDPVADPFQWLLNGCEGVDEIVATIGAGASRPELEDQVSYKNFYNDVFDELNQPAQSACLNQKFPNDCSDPVNVALQNFDGEPHGLYRLNDEVIDATYRHVTSRKAR
jgi:pimeloyl-ACP methyl ester carboxylesterase